MPNTPQPQKILVIKLRAIGDVLLSTVVLPNVREAFPSAAIDMLTEAMSSDVLAGNPDLSDVLVFDARRESGLSLIRRVRKRRYDLVIDLFGNPRSALVALTSGARERVGFRFGWRTCCYTTVVEPRGGEVHNTEFNLDALRAAKIPVRSRTLTFPVGADAVRTADEFFLNAGLEGRFVVALNPGGGWATKRWGTEHYARLGEMLSAEFGAAIVVIWGPGEEKVAAQIRDSMRAPAMLIPRTSLKELAAIVRRCNLMVTNDSGPMHIASAMKTPIVAIFGPTNPQLQGPFGAPHAVVQHLGVLCLGCNLTSCPIGNPCMAELMPDAVFEACREFVHRNRLLHEHGTLT